MRHSAEFLPYRPGAENKERAGNTHPTVSLAGKHPVSAWNARGNAERKHEEPVPFWTACGAIRGRPVWPVPRLQWEWERTQLLASLQAGLSHAAAARMTDLSSQLTLIQARLEAHSPEQTLRRGYALVENQDKQLIRQTNQVHAGEKLKIRVSDGCFYVRDDTPQ